ncbi:MAG: TatD family hydrolase [Syntrophales bacterium]|jgi:TatD DNase family protein|nr:TatD family hydrolase [Syntrophales bacterium]MCK9528097.1 TatD family hydrolase [Syntrophales bacterium]MDX9922307.1 TatD family hydrolase [Syntrophales bacterium]
MLIDSHAHLELGNFDRDRDDVIKRARAAGLRAIVTVGIDLEDSRKAVALARRYDMVWASVGVHPHDAGNIGPETYDELKILAADDKVIAYGEIGLDFFKNYSPRNTQIARFGEQLDLCRDIGLPVIIHDRDAHGETLAMLEEHRGNLTGVVHCFSGDYAMARRCLDLGYYISIPGTVTYGKAETLREVVRAVPLNRLMVETDAPFLSPEPKRGKRNEPAFVVYTARKIADLRGESFERVARETTKNAQKLFGIPPAKT